MCSLGWYCGGCVCCVMRCFSRLLQLVELVKVVVGVSLVVWVWCCVVMLVLICGIDWVEVY